MTCIAFYLFHIDVHLVHNPETCQRIFYIFSHANIFHLAVNLTALLRFRPRAKTCIVALAVSYAVTFIPFAHLQVPTCGLSGFLMACFARHYRAWRKPVWPPLLANLALAPVPYVNWRIHILCFTVSYCIYAAIQKRGK